jgi:hypothetical protein
LLINPDAAKERKGRKEFQPLICRANIVARSWSSFGKYMKIRFSRFNTAGRRFNTV